MPSDQPPRRFAPTPIETSTKSSRQSAQPNGDGPRKFNIEPAETTTRSNKDAGRNNGETDSQNQQPRRFAPQPIETSIKSSKDAPQPQQPARRFAPEPVETSVKSSKDKQQAQTQQSRRFAPEPVETSTKSSRNPEGASEKPKSRFLPQPIETSVKSNRANAVDDESMSPTSKPKDSPSEKPVRRRFAPQLIDTSARSRKNSDEKPSFSAADKTDITPGEESRTIYNNHGQQVSVTEKQPSPATEQPKFLAHFARRKERSDSGRSHSFRLPDLETIESSESEPSAPPSLSTSPSSNDFSLGASFQPSNPAYKHATRIRESVDETFGRYLLELEARKAQDRLREQALAAFPNSDYHEPVNHYVDEESDGEQLDDRPATWEGHDDEDFMMFNRASHQRSSTHGTFEVLEMQEHHDQLEQERKAAATTRRKSSVKPSPWWNQGHDFAGSSYPDTEMRQMRDRARPPMLGADLRFPRSASPEPARFDVTQGSNVLRSQMCYLTEQSEANNSPEGLWGGNKESSQRRSQLSTHSNRSTQSQGGGLWGGFCKDSSFGQTGGLAPPSGPTGLMTPMVEPENPFETQGGWKLPPPTTLPQTPPESEQKNSGIDIILSEDNELDELMAREYPDSFVTQVYNYLSLGYPTLARPFDEELSKISHVPVAELRHDDEIAKNMPKGYIRLGEDFEGRGDGSDQSLQEGGCARWKALKKYIREWARQEKNMVKTEGLAGNWGTGARRGSWAW